MRLKSSKDGTRLTGNEGKDGEEEGDGDAAESLRGAGAASVRFSFEGMGVWFWFVIRMAALLSQSRYVISIKPFIESIGKNLPSIHVKKMILSDDKPCGMTVRNGFEG